MFRHVLARLPLPRLGVALCSDFGWEIAPRSLGKLIFKFVTDIKGTCNPSARCNEQVGGEDLADARVE